MIAVLDPAPLRLSRLYDRQRPPFRLTPQVALAEGLVATAQFAIGFSIAHTYFAGLPQDRPADPNPVIATLQRFIIPKPVLTPTPLKPVSHVAPIPFTPTLHEPTTPTAPMDDPLRVAPHTDGPVTDTSANPFVPVDRVPVSPAVPPKIPVIGNPNWVSKPTAEQVGRLYPVRAAQSGVSGRATLLCEVLGSGAVGVCTVTDETPKGYHFGDAAQSMTRYFKLSPQTVDGVSVAGSKVRIPIVFNLG
jgi:protein TonB